MLKQRAWLSFTLLHLLRRICLQINSWSWPLHMWLNLRDVTDSDCQNGHVFLTDTNFNTVYIIGCFAFYRCVWRFLFFLSRHLQLFLYLVFFKCWPCADNIALNRECCIACSESAQISNMTSDYWDSPRELMCLHLLLLSMKYTRKTCGFSLSDRHRLEMDLSSSGKLLS